LGLHFTQTGEVVNGIFLQEILLSLVVVEGFKGDSLQSTRGNDGQGLIRGNLGFNGTNQQVIELGTEGAIDDF
jgi:hypothetical protein